ncbi:RnfABCDGE type electron transport complex subunit D [Celeribacter sp. PS-C1]|uniref:RnfABCDGE type electron transport complex subunit D n=1 Tax=Celeribacter sp. PS-C1 TaxID=2820813 RepID=UPI001CA5A4BF|nr:RnfABCDGE type electron transport complex subunit D [Celeribacter sp. PS-C1]MBW6418585.1 RnfABCDGE type electron transport complex subunit D [Celeribacter sp. PS-C1]
MRRGMWDREMVAALLLMASMPMVLTWLWFGGVEAIGRLALTLIISGLWHMVFMLARAQPPSLAGALSAIAVAMLAPEDLGLIRLALGISFGTVAAELVFGGWGRNVLNPATVTIAFLGFGFPAEPWPEFVAPVIWAALPALGIGAMFGILSMRVIFAAFVALGIAYYGGDPAISVILPTAVLVLALLVTDPVAGASTSLGRWLYGGAYGGFVVLFAYEWEGAAPVQMAVSAAFLASLFAPIFDEAALALWVRRRRKRHG